MFAAGIQAERENRRVFREPDFVYRLWRARLSELLHAAPERLVILYSKVAHDDGPGLGQSFGGQ